MDVNIPSSDIDLIEEVYAATTQEGSLKAAAQLFLTLQGDPGGAMFHYDSIAETPKEFEVITANPDQESLVQGVFDNYFKSSGGLDNPLINAGYNDLIAGKVLVSDDVIPYEDFKKTEYYKAVFKPLGIRRSMGWVAIGNAQTWLTFTSSRDEMGGCYQAEHIKRANLFKRHLARAMHILELLTEAEGSRFVFEQAIDRVPQGIILVDEYLNIHFYNASARELVASSRSFSTSGNRLRFGTTSHERALFENWWSLLNRTQINDGARFKPLSIEPIWEIEASRVASSLNDVGGKRWMLTLKQRPDSRELSSEYLIARYGLTKAEAQVCISLCNNGDAVSTASALGVTTNTIRTHLKNAFRKTNTRNQVELAVKIVSNLAE